MHLKPASEVYIQDIFLQLTVNSHLLRSLSVASNNTDVLFLAVETAGALSPALATSLASVFKDPQSFTSNHSFHRRFPPKLAM